MNAGRRSQHGVALIVALLVVALATILIAALLDRGGLVAARTRNGLRDMQAQDYAIGLEGYAAHVLRQDDSVDSTTDSADDVWAIPLPPTPVPGGEITATMTDLDGRFNLNNLVIDTTNASAQNPTQAQWKEAFNRLLDALKLDPTLAQNIENWMNSGPAANTDDAWYAAQPVAYRSGKRIFSHVSELRLVKGFDGDTYARILPHVSALPVGTTININTATVPVLMTLADGYSEQEATGAWQQGHAHFGSSDLTNPPSGQNLLPHIKYPKQYGVQSHYFVARGDITLDGLPFTFYSLIERRLGGGGTGSDAGIHVLQRSRGGD